MSAHKLINLDGMRGIAALFVFFRHTGDLWGVDSFFHSYLAVDVFFILSGYVIAYSYDHRFATESMTTRSFVVTRLIRLYPMYLFGLILGLLWVLTKLNLGLGFELIDVEKIYLAIVLSSMFLPTNIGPGQTLFPLNPPSWSLFYELVANFLYAISRKLLYPAALICVLAFGAAILAYCAFKLTHLDVGPMGGVKAMFAAAVRAIFGVFFGIFLFKINTKVRIPILPSWVSPLVIGLIALILMAPSFGSFNWVFDTVVIAVFLPILVLAAARLSTPPILVKAFIFLGFLSYPLYVIHVPLYEMFKVLFDHQAYWYKTYGGCILLIFVVLASVVSVKYIDEPFRLYLKRKFLP